MAGYYWPANAAVGLGVEALVSAFTSQGYELCGDGTLEQAFEKVVLFANALGEWTHAAKQLSDGRWSSKLGDAEDITHTTPAGVAGVIYGDVKYYMKRPRQP
jgi:hypothetical protein